MLQFIIILSEITILLDVPLNIIECRLAFIVQLIQPGEGLQELGLVERPQQHIKSILLIRFERLNQTTSAHIVRMLINTKRTMSLHPVQRE